MPLSCHQSFPINDVFIASELWFQSRTRPPLVTIILIADTKSTYLHDIEQIIQKQNKDTYVNRLFLLSHRFGDESNQMYYIQFLYFYESFPDLNFVKLFAVLCKTTCTDYLEAFTTTGSSVTSYYHVADVLNRTHDQSVQYCKERPQSYLVSLESPSELVFLFNLLKESPLVKDLKRHFSVPLGIKNDFNEFYWESGNPFLFVNDFYKTSYGECFFINSSSIERIEFIDDITEHLMRHVFTENCSKEVSEPFVICECQEVIVNQDLTLSVLAEVSRNENMFEISSCRHPELDLYSSGNVSHDSFQLIECDQNVSSDNKYTQRYVCSKKLCNKLNTIRNDTLFLVLLLLSGNNYSIYESFAMSDCKSLMERPQNETIESLSGQGFTTDIDWFCLNQSVGKDARKISTANDAQYPRVPCATHPKEFVHKCIKSRFRCKSPSGCISNSHLQNCEHFKCPKGFVKCPNSYCISHTYINDDYRDCPSGEDEFESTLFLGSVQISYKHKGLCIHEQDKSSFQLRNGTHFLCNIPCPRNYVCISSRRTKYNQSTGADYAEYIYKLTVGLYNLSNLAYPLQKHTRVSHLFQMVELYGPYCRIENFDFAFQYWNLLEVIVLDLSYNELISSNHMKSITGLSHLKVLNISHNQNLTIDQNFVFPRSLEIIDFSYTKTSTLKLNVFENVSFLKHLNLSNTLVSTFQDMGIPEYFTLETLYIENIEMTNISENFFRGLTINSELRASDYKLCCPQILNPNISVDKCHAPVDVISSCKHLVGDIVKRITIWTVGLITLVANGIVLVYRIGWNREIFKKAYGLFVSGLAVSDFIMGMYLLLIAIVDIHYKDIYVLEDVKWRQSVLCQLAGIMSTLSSETSTFFICLITIDRFMKITFPFGQHRFTNTGKKLSFTLVWLIGILLAVLPILSKEWAIYSSNGLCLALPFSSKYHKGWIFSFVIFVVLNFIFFLFIALGQILIFANILSIKNKVKNANNDKSRRAQDYNIAKKLALVALTDFMCWFPVGILGFLSLNGYIFEREVYAWVVVFVLPINSALNPMIYTLLAIYEKCRTI
ncbi:G-protein coupled receptor GRL101 [Biomphalaria glabrata]